MDAAVAPLLRLFHCPSYKCPCRILTEYEVSVLSGLHEHWKKTSSKDANNLPEALTRNMCGNSSHPALIDSALGSNELLRRWVSDPDEGSMISVANQQQAFAIFSALCDKVEKEGKTKHKDRDFKTLTSFQTVATDEVALPTPVIHPQLLNGCTSLEVSKVDRYILHFTLC